MLSRLARLRGFTLLELMIVIGIVSALALVALPLFSRYLRRAKTIEATMNVRKIYDSSVAYYEAVHAAPDGSILERQFTDPQGWTPVQGGCCGQIGNKCPATPSLWAQPSWMELNFTVDDPHYYSYQLTDTIGTGSSLGDMQDIQASGDLNCNGNFSLFQRTIIVGSDYVLTGGSGLYTINEVE